MSLWGVDVSNRQKGADLGRVHAAGASWAYAKASEGLTFTDQLHATYRAQAKAAGLLFGSYHFARPSSTRRAADEVAHFLACIGTVEVGELPPVLDVEVAGDLTPPQLAAWALEWLTLVEARTGVRPIVYSSRNFAATYLRRPELARFGLWLAAYQAYPVKAPPPWQPAAWLFWQHTSAAKVPGVPGNCDRNLTNLTPAALRALARRPAVAPAPRPTVVPARPAAGPSSSTRPPARPLPTRPSSSPAARPAATSAHQLGSRTLVEGMTGDDVATVQRFLGLHDDGEFGPETRAAVEHYQAVQLLHRDGEVGPETWGRILSAVRH